LTTELRDTV